MKKIDKSVQKEILFILLVTLILCVLMQSVFLVIGKWDYTVLLGGLLGFASVAANYFLLGLSVQSATEKEEKQSKQLLRASQSLRLLMMLVFLVIGYFVDIFNVVPVIITVFFPRIALLIRPALDKKRQKGGEDISEE